jgi:hypothetical protein
MNELTKPNAFVFKAYIDGEYRLCVCPRIDDKWSEKDIVYIKDDPYKEFDDVLDNKLFSVIFVGYIKDSENDKGFTLKHINSHYMKSDSDLSETMYQQGIFFNTIEKGYQQFYEQQSSGKGITSTSSEERSV